MLHARGKDGISGGMEIDYGEQGLEKMEHTLDATKSDYILLSLRNSLLSHSLLLFFLSLSLSAWVLWLCCVGVEGVRPLGTHTYMLFPPLRYTCVRTGVYMCAFVRGRGKSTQVLDSW